MLPARQNRKWNWNDSDLFAYEAELLGTEVLAQVCLWQCNALVAGLMVVSASLSSPGVQMFICNREHYGFLPMPLKPQQSLQEEAENFVHTLIEAMSELLCPCCDGSPKLMPAEPSCQQPSSHSLGSLHPSLSALILF